MGIAKIACEGRLPGDVLSRYSALVFQPGLQYHRSDSKDAALKVSHGARTIHPEAQHASHQGSGTHSRKESGQSCPASGDFLGWPPMLKNSCRKRWFLDRKEYVQELLSWSCFKFLNYGWAENKEGYKDYGTYRHIDLSIYGLR